MNSNNWCRRTHNSSLLNLMCNSEGLQNWTCSHAGMHAYTFGINWLKLFNHLIILCFVTVCCFWCVFDRNCRRLLYLMSKACYLFVCNLYLSVLPVCKVFCQSVYLLCVFDFPPSSYHPDSSIDLVVSVSIFQCCVSRELHVWSQRRICLAHSVPSVFFRISWLFSYSIRSDISLCRSVRNFLSGK